MATTVIPVLAAAFALAGAAKLRRRPSRRLMPWVDDFRQQTVRMIGVAELAGAVGLLLRPVRGVAALCLGMLMAGGIVVHLRRGEVLRCAPAAVLLGGCAAVLSGRRSRGGSGAAAQPNPASAASIAAPMPGSRSIE